MKKVTITIPNYKEISISHVVLDYNGTIAKDGIFKESLKELLPQLTAKYMVHVITADTFGTVKEQLKEFDVEIKLLSSENHTLEKAKYIQGLNSKSCVAIGNGNNDKLMLEEAEIGIALLGDEGCSLKTVLNSDIICKSIDDAVELFIYPKRLIATLRV